MECSHHRSWTRVCKKHCSLPAFVISPPCKITVLPNSPNSSLFSDNCLISLSRPPPVRKLQFWATVRLDRSGSSAHCAHCACPWSCAAFQDIVQISSPERGAASEYFLLAHVPPLWTEQLWQAVCQNATVLCAYKNVLTQTEGLVTAALLVD